MKNWTACIIASIICRFLGLVAVLAFVYFMVVLTSKLGCLWLLFLIFAVDYIPTYEFKRENLKDKGDKSND
jgi:hypothetical protein